MQDSGSLMSICLLCFSMCVCVYMYIRVSVAVACVSNIRMLIKTVQHTVNEQTLPHFLKVNRKHSQPKWSKMH